MGIDIRDGHQLECITCALCIDACDSVMDKIGTPARADLLHDAARLQRPRRRSRDARAAPPRPRTSASIGVSHIVRPRTLLYFGLWSLVGLVMLVGLLTRDRLDINVLPDRNPLYVTLSDGSIRNGYTVKVLNMTAEPRTFEVAIDGLPGAAHVARRRRRATAGPRHRRRRRGRPAARGQGVRLPAGHAVRARADRLRLHRPRPRRLGDAASAAADFYAPGG